MGRYCREALDAGGAYLSPEPVVLHRLLLEVFSVTALALH